MTDAQILSAGIAIGTALSGAVSALFFYFVNSKGETITVLKQAIIALEMRADKSDAKHQECEDDRILILQKLASMTGDASLLTRCPGGDNGNCPLWSPKRRLEELKHRQEQMSYSMAPTPKPKET